MAAYHRFNATIVRVNASENSWKLFSARGEIIQTKVVRFKGGRATCSLSREALLSADYPPAIAGKRPERTRVRAYLLISHYYARYARQYLLLAVIE